MGVDLTLRTLFRGSDPELSALCSWLHSGHTLQHCDHSWVIFDQYVSSVTALFQSWLCFDPLLG